MKMKNRSDEPTYLTKVIFYLILFHTAWCMIRQQLRQLVNSHFDFVVEILERIASNTYIVSALVFFFCRKWPTAAMRKEGMLQQCQRSFRAKNTIIQKEVTQPVIPTGCAIVNTSKIMLSYNYTMRFIGYDSIQSR